MTRERLQSLLLKLPSLRIAVVGDLFLDRYWMIDPALDEPSLETGLDAWQVVDTRLSPGAAGTVINNLCALGIGRVHCISLLGQDAEGFALKQLLQARGVDMEGTVESEGFHTPFYTKPMFLQPDGTWKEGHRLDRKNHGVTLEALQQRMVAGMQALKQQVDAIILLDQLTQENTGVVTTAVRDAAAALAEQHPELVVFADSRAFLHKFRTISIKCNDQEAAALTGGQKDGAFDQEAVFASLQALQQPTPRPVFVTCNRHGIAVMADGQPQLEPAVKQEGPIDVVGAGDASTAGMVTALCTGATPREAAAFANLCAGVTVRKLGTTGTASPDEVLALFDEQKATTHEQ